MKRNFIKFRCSTYQKKLIQFSAKKAGLTVSEFCRKAAFKKEITQRLDDDFILYYKTLVSYHNNFKRIGNMFQKKDPKLSLKVNELADEIKIILNKLQK